MRVFVVHLDPHFGVVEVRDREVELYLSAVSFALVVLLFVIGLTVDQNLNVQQFFDRR